MTTESSASHASGPRGKIWVLTVGSRGDTQPVVALAQGLQDAGYRVTAYGSSFMSTFFSAYNIDFHPFDGPIALHKDNWRGSAALDQQAAEAGFPAGPDRSADYLMDCIVLSYEWLLNIITDMLEVQKPLDEIAKTVAEFLAGVKEFWKTGSHIETLPQRRTECRGHVERTVRASLKGQEYSGQADKRRARFTAFMKGKAAELCRHPVSLVDGWYTIFVQSLSGLAAESPAKLQASILEFREWLLKDDWDGEAFFQNWWTRLNFRGVEMVNNTLNGGDLSKRYMQLEAAHVAAEDRPDVVIYHFALVSTALMLQDMGLVQKNKTLCWYPQLPPTEELRQFQRYLELVLLDLASPPDLRPLLNRGPFFFVDLLQCSPGSERLIISASSALVTEADCEGDGEYQRRLRSCCVGAFTAEERVQQLTGEDGFGTSEEAESLQGFLSSSPGAPVVCFTFGSMPLRMLAELSPRDVAVIVARTAAACNVRAIFIAGFSGVDRKIFSQAVAEVVGESEDNAQRFLWLSAAVHRELFPRCAAVVHHGGLGTFQSVLRAGVPAVVVPTTLAIDQHTNGELGKRLGVAATTRELQKLTHIELTSALQGVLDNKEMQSKAEQIASVMQKERGVEAGVQLVEQLIAAPEPEPAPEVVVPWPSGWYTTHVPGIPPFPTEIRDDKILLAGNPTTWLRHGSFRKNGVNYTVKFFNCTLARIDLFEMSNDAQTFYNETGARIEYAEHGWMSTILSVLPSGSECTCA